jgi:hypothetical protein
MSKVKGIFMLSIAFLLALPVLALATLMALFLLPDAILEWVGWHYRRVEDLFDGLFW